MAAARGALPRRLAVSALPAMDPAKCEQIQLAKAVLCQDCETIDC